MPEAEPAPARILVVEKDESVLDALVPVLRERRCTVETSAAPEDAFARLAAVSFDLVIIDLALADGDSCEWLRRARLLRPETRVLVITAENTPANVICAIRERAFGYFSKPFSPRAVADMASQALETPSWQDDIEIVSATPYWVTLLVRCKMDTADRLVQFLREMKADIPADRREDIASALRELLLNAIEHGCGCDPGKRIRVSYIRTARAIVYHIEDPGPGFSFEYISHAAVSNPPGEPVHHVEVREGQGVRPGGFGILLSRNLADELIYNEKGNEVLFIKYLK
jgi:CheY-like chemotaxis protein